MLRCLVQGPREAPVLGRGRGRGRPWPPVDRAEPWEHPRACIFSTAPEAGTWWPGWGLGGGGRGSSSSGPGAGPRPPRLECLSHHPVAPQQGHYSPILQMKKPKLLSPPGNPVLAPQQSLEVMGPPWVLPRAVQPGPGKARAGEGPEPQKQLPPGCCRGWGKGPLAGGHQDRRCGASWPTQRATRCSCQDNRASPIPLGCRGAASGPWPQAQAPGTPGKGLPESGGPPHRGHLILSTHTCPSRCQRHRHWRAAGRAAGFLSATESAFTHPLLCRTGPACNRRRRGDPETERDVETQTLATCTLNTHT